MLEMKFDTKKAPLGERDSVIDVEFTVSLSRFHTPGVFTPICRKADLGADPFRLHCAEEDRGVSEEQEQQEDAGRRLQPVLHPYPS